jgi:hypothetical protein
VKLLLLAFVIASTLAVAGAQQRPADAPMTREEFDKLQKADYEAHGHGEGSLVPGDPAPDFDLKVVGGEGRIRLSSFAGKRPVVLVFGTYT